MVSPLPVLGLAGRGYGRRGGQFEPTHGGDLNSVLAFFNLCDQAAKRLLAITVESFFIPDIPHPIPALYGEHGSAKTTLSRFIRAWEDPSATATMGEPDRDEIILALAHNYVLPLDNLRRIEPRLSDILGRAITGEGFTKRMLFTEQHDIIFAFRRCVALNGINSLPQRPDLLDRSILFRLSAIPKGKRREELEIIAEFEGALPLILGATFTLLSEAMKLRDGFRLTTAPRMADFARWGAVISQAAGWGAKQFVTNYKQEASSRNEAAIEASPVVQTVRVFAEERKSEWEGTTGELLPELAKIASQLGIDTRVRQWPKQPNVLSRRLNEIAPNLRDPG